MQPYFSPNALPPVISGFVTMPSLSSTVTTSLSLLARRLMHFLLASITIKQLSWGGG